MCRPVGVAVKDGSHSRGNKSKSLVYLNEQEQVSTGSSTGTYLLYDSSDQITSDYAGRNTLIMYCTVVDDQSKGNPQCVCDTDSKETD